MPQHPTHIYILLVVLCLCPRTALGHDFPDKHTLFKNMLSARNTYEQCLKKSKAHKSQEKACRKTYALTRSFSPAELWHIFQEHPLEAYELYENLLVAVRGTVHRTGTSALGYPEIVLASDAFGLTGIRCILPKGAALSIRPGDNITVGGICTGLERDRYVILNHAEIYE